MKLSAALTNKTALIIALLISFMIYGNTLGNQYALDDAIVITKNQFVKQGFSGIPDIITGDSFLGFFGTKKDLVAGGRYRPLSLVTFAVEYQIFGETPWPNHLINILIYALSGWLVYLILKKLLVNRFEEKPLFLISAFSALLFLIHPIHTEVVANIKGRDELMALMFSLLCFYFVLKFIDGNKIHQLFWAAICLFLGAMSKENALAFVVVIPVACWFFGKPSKKSWVLVIIGLMIPVAVFLAIRSKVLGPVSNITPDELMNNPFLYATGSQKYATILYTWFIYLKLLVFPHPLTYDYYPYHIQLVNFSNPAVIIMMFLLMIFAYLVLAGLKNKTITAFIIIAFVSTFIMVSNLIFPIGTFMNERFVFMPSVFWSLAIVAPLVTGYKNKTKFPSKPVIAVIGIYILTFYPVKTIARNRAWKNDLTLFVTDVKTSVNSAKSNCSAGGKLWEEGKTIANRTIKNNYFEQSEKYLRKAIQVHPDYVDAWLLLGNLLFDSKKDYVNSAQCYFEVLRRQPGNINAWQNIDVVVPQSTDYKWAQGFYSNLLRIDSNQFKPNYRLGVIYGRYLGNLPLCLRYLEKAHQIDPGNIEAMKDLGTAYGMSGLPAKAVPIFEKALQINPNDPQIYFNYGLSCLQMGNKAKADSLFALSEKYKNK
jgi:protein O-mannosyl-transferase